MSARIHRYRPNFFSGYEDEYAEAETLEQLLAIPWIHQWSTRENFHQFSYSASEAVGHVMAELDGGRKWYVTATILGTETFRLPRWEPPSEEEP